MADEGPGPGDSGKASGLAPGQIEVAHTHPGLHLPAARVEELARQVLKAEGAQPLYIGIVLSRRDHIHDMNKRFLSHDYPTDVLSFPISEALNALEGEVYIDLDMAADRAPEFHTTFQKEAVRYVIHGLLHLVGHDDDAPDGRAAMRDLENRYLTTFWDRNTG
ncbi:MAG: putative rRNA maturation factor [Rhodothermales bacterium]